MSRRRHPPLVVMVLEDGGSCRVYHRARVSAPRLLIHPRRFGLCDDVNHH